MTNHFWPFFIILFAGLLSSSVFRRFHLPWVIALIGAGIIIGPYFLDLYEASVVTEFLAEIGLVFLMFMAGLEVKLSSLKHIGWKLIVLATINGFIPFLVGFGITSFLGYQLMTSLLVGIVFVSSSIAVVVPTLEANGLIVTTLGKSVIGSIVVQDIASLVLLSAFLQIQDPGTNIPLPIFFFVLIVTLYGFRMILPKVQDYFANRLQADVFQQELQVAFLGLFGVVIAFELLGLHQIVAGFFAGLVLSDAVSQDGLTDKIHAIGYGLFVPVFFVVVGTQINLGVFAQAQQTLSLVILVILGSVMAKIISGTVAGRIVGFYWPQAVFIGSASVPQLSTTLAATFSIAAAGLFTEELTTAMIALVVFTTLIGPSLMHYFSQSVLSYKDVHNPKVTTQPSIGHRLWLPLRSWWHQKQQQNK